MGKSSLVSHLPLICRSQCGDVRECPKGILQRKLEQTQMVWSLTASPRVKPYALLTWLKLLSPRTRLRYQSLCLIKFKGINWPQSEHAKPKLGSFFQIVLYPLKPKQVKSSSLHYFKVTTSCLVASDPGPFHCNPTLMLCRVLSEIRTSSDWVSVEPEDVPLDKGQKNEEPHSRIRGWISALVKEEIKFHEPGI